MGEKMENNIFKILLFDSATSCNSLIFNALKLLLEAEGIAFEIYRFRKNPDGIFDILVIDARTAFTDFYSGNSEPIKQLCKEFKNTEKPIIGIGNDDYSSFFKLHLDIDNFINVGKHPIEKVWEKFKKFSQTLK